MTLSDELADLSFFATIVNITYKLEVSTKALRKVEIKEGSTFCHMIVSSDEDRTLENSRNFLIQFLINYDDENDSTNEDGSEKIDDDKKVQIKQVEQELHDGFNTIEFTIGPNKDKDKNKNKNKDKIKPGSEIRYNSNRKKWTFSKTIQEIIGNKSQGSSAKLTITLKPNSQKNMYNDDSFEEDNEDLVTNEEIFSLLQYILKVTR
ncbi:hypothetical protein TRFO_25795 [Tritrichomonas foetus]|uniref:Uncharacterized protein n=1 Tax=Tritrichomonas foetus TaxID=1144522 RepID=A0A1J4K4W2_9EUKA|nr:hypothetical protein TRFO_25795 [Tritrichomonas foetus]|eukprot:OHT06235.1 hypothetical protein TRFO_25795 [Tritrichomonas foetus]